MSTHRQKSDQDVAAAARAWGRMRLLVLAVKDARNSCRCEQEERGYTDYEAGVDDTGVPPCWKSNEWDRDYQPTDASQWCAPCLERQKWHLALVAIKRMHGGRFRRLQRFAASRRSE